MKRRLLLACVAAVTLTASPALASPITADGTWHEFRFGLATSAAFGCAGTCSGTTNPLAEQVSTAPWTWTGAGTLTVLDLFTAGDRFEVFDNLVSLGLTSIPGTGVSCDNNIGCALADLNYSRLVVSIAGGGSHSLTINIVQNAANTSLGAAVFQLSAPTSAVPEPASLTLLGTGLAAAYLRRRKRSGDDAAL
jgi:hypothetical protein